MNLGEANEKKIVASFQSSKISLYSFEATDLVESLTWKGHDYSEVWAISYHKFNDSLLFSGLIND